MARHPALCGCGPAVFSFSAKHNVNVLKSPGVQEDPIWGPWVRGERVRRTERPRGGGGAWAVRASESLRMTFQEKVRDSEHPWKISKDTCLLDPQNSRNSTGCLLLLPASLPGKRRSSHCFTPERNVEEVAFYPQNGFIFSFLINERFTLL